MPTMQTDPRSGGVKRKSGVNVLPSVVGKSPLLLFFHFPFHAITVDADGFGVMLFFAFACLSSVLVL